MPSLPNSLIDVQDGLNSMPIETVKKDNFLLVNDQQNNIVIFSCYTNLNFLCSVGKSVLNTI
jgi:hypothetical protein